MENDFYPEPYEKDLSEFPICDECGEEFKPNWDTFICDACKTAEWDNEAEHPLDRAEREFQEDQNAGLEDFGGYGA